MQERLFRKSALDRLASPDQLDRLMQVTDLPGWASLIGLGLLLFAVLVWSIAGSIPVTITGDGVLLASATGLEAVIFVPLEESQELRPGLEVQVEPLTVNHEEFGYLRGEILSIQTSVASSADLRRVFGTRPYDREMLLVEVRIKLKVDQSADSGYAWTVGRGPAFELLGGTPIEARITVRQERPITRLFG